MPSAIPPRKLDMEYAQALAWLLARANEARAGGTGRALSARSSTSGDTMLNDGGAFKNLRTLTGWPGWCFIGAEKDEALQADGAGRAVHRRTGGSRVADFLQHVHGRGRGHRTVHGRHRGHRQDGARRPGRNDKSIDHARTAAMEATLRMRSGRAFAATSSGRPMPASASPKYHPFTADNQDNVAYICLMLSAGLVEIGCVLCATWTAGISRTSASSWRRWTSDGDELPPEVRALHDDIYARTLAGDLTPFKAFRRREYQETVDRMGHLPEDAQLAQRLVEEICMTREVLEACEWLKARGCLMVALSDKPDEATSPSPELAERGVCAAAPEAHARGGAWHRVLAQPAGVR